MLAILKEDLDHCTKSNHGSNEGNPNDFVQLFPTELCNKLFSYLPEKDLVAASCCCLRWHQVINNNAQWKIRCIRRGWANPTDGPAEFLKWFNVSSHISDRDMYKFRASPAFRLPDVASLRMSPICDWGFYFRQCMHLKRNWNKGIYVIHRLTEANVATYEDCSMLNNSFDCDGRLLVCGTSSGKVLIWSVEGVPKFLASFSLRRRLEVEAVILKRNFLIVLYQTGLIKVFDTSHILNEKDRGSTGLQLVYAVRGLGTIAEEEINFSLSVQPVDSSISDALETDHESDIEYWIRDLFRVDLWLGNEILESGSEMLIYANENFVILTGVFCSCFFAWKIDNSKDMVRITLPNDLQVTYQSFLSSSKIYLSTKSRELDQDEIPFYHILVYDLSSTPQSQTPSFILGITPSLIPSQTMVEEIRPDSSDRRIAFTTQNGLVCGIRFLENGTEDLFRIQAGSFIDNLTVSEDVIVYHQYDGFLVGLDWMGIMLYQIEAHIGLVKGLQIYGNKLVSGGDAMQLCVWDVRTGNRLHTVHHQPCRIQNLYVDATKIVTIGREDLPVVVAYW